MLSHLLASEPIVGQTLEKVLNDVCSTLELDDLALRWPIQGTSQINLIVGPGKQESQKWESEVVGRLAGAKSSTEAFADPKNDHRLHIPLLFQGRRNGAISASRSETISEEDCIFLTVVAQCLGKHPLLLERVGASHDQFQVAQRLQDAAVVAGKIAHDFDNIFTGVVGFAEMAQSMLEPGSMPSQYVTEITSAGNRGIAFTQQLHQMSRSGMARPMPTNVGGVLAREETRLKKSAPTVRLQCAAASDLPAVLMDPAALQTVLSHLLDNAVEASPPNGVIRVSTALIELSDAEAREYYGGATAGPYVELRIADEGSGVRDDYRKRLFVEPFFTTKVRHRGLGLAIVFRILYAHRGGVRFESNSTRGSVFHVVLPLAAARTSEPGNVPSVRI
ncbi:MAG: hypothetical protein K8T89_01320 [Planctomycetes bacterium]|nr:hypothetical protein [Planctomycetota bacterium]